MPLEELGGRPRIDVLCNMSGIFRDSFQNVVELLDDLFQRAADADEPESLNFIRQALTALPCMASAQSLTPGHLINIACEKKSVWQSFCIDTLFEHGTCSLWAFLTIQLLGNFVGRIAELLDIGHWASMVREENGGSSLMCV